MATRLPFKLPEFSPRITWASPPAREVWWPRVQIVSQAFIINERLSVVHGLRQAALQTITEPELTPLMSEMAHHGLAVLPLTRTPRASGYQSASRSAQPGETLDYRIVIAKPQDAAAFSDAFHAIDNETVGRMLGFPECCRRFFDRVWVGERWMDTTVPMYANDVQAFAKQKQDNGFAFLGGVPSTLLRPQINMLWRWLGVRPVSRLPCSPNCVETLTVTNKWREITPQPARQWMDEILSWPVLYTSLRGIAEITSPIHRMSVPTDALAEKVRIAHHGAGYPAEGAAGSEFPYQRAVPMQFGNMSNPADNGFSSLAAMVQAHNELVKVACGPYDTILDLGCGDGTLARRIPAKRRIGVESDPRRAELARKRLDFVWEGDCTKDSFLKMVLSVDRPDIIIAQRDRNPPDTLKGWRVLSYSYEAGAEPARIVE